MYHLEITWRNNNVKVKYFLGHRLEEMIYLNTRDIEWDEYMNNSNQLVRFSPCDQEADLSKPFELCVCYHGSDYICHQKRLYWNGINQM